MQSKTVDKTSPELVKKYSRESNIFRGLGHLKFGPGTCMKLIALSSYHMSDRKYMFKGQMYIQGFSYQVTIL